MTRDETLELLRADEDLLRKKYFVKSLALFGSAARDHAAPDSDVDLLVEFDRRISLFDLVETALYLEKRLGVERVDLVLRRAVIPELRDIIYGEAINVFGATPLEIPVGTHEASREQPFLRGMRVP